MIRAILVGYGAFGRVYARRLIEHADFELVGIVDSGSNIEPAAATGVRVYSRLSDALRCESPGVVIVAASEEAHAELAIESFGASCSVFLAKPGALSMPSALRVADAAVTSSRALMVDWTALRMPGWDEARKDAATLGDITCAKFTRASWAIPRACGALWDLVPHDVALALSIDDDRVVDVSADAWDRGVQLVLRHESGRVSRIEADYAAGVRARRVDIAGTERVVSWDADDAAPGRDAVSLGFDRFCRIVRGVERDDLGMFLCVMRVLCAAESDIAAKAAARRRVELVA